MIWLLFFDLMSWYIDAMLPLIFAAIAIIAIIIITLFHILFAILPLLLMPCRHFDITLPLLPCHYFSYIIIDIMSYAIIWCY
jgi:hypothetical protein